MVDNVGPRISEQERLGLVPPTIPPPLARPLRPGYTGDGELVIRTRRRLAIVALCLCWPVGFVALTLS